MNRVMQFQHSVGNAVVQTGCQSEEPGDWMTLISSPVLAGDAP